MVTGSFTAYFLLGVHSGVLEGEEGELYGSMVDTDSHNGIMNALELTVVD